MTKNKSKSKGPDADAAAEPVTLVYQPTRTAWAPGHRPGDEIQVSADAARRLEATGAWRRKATDRDADPADSGTAKPVREE